MNWVKWKCNDPSGTTMDGFAQMGPILNSILPT
jgi:hypothetical protein